MNQQDDVDISFELAFIRFNTPGKKPAYQEKYARKKYARKKVVRTDVIYLFNGIIKPPIYPCGMYGSFTAPSDGVMKFKFGNKHSWVMSKAITYSVDVESGQNPPLQTEQIDKIIEGPSGTTSNTQEVFETDRLKHVAETETIPDKQSVAIPNLTAGAASLSDINIVVGHQNGSPQQVDLQIDDDDI